MNNNFDTSVNRFGRFSSIVALILMSMPPLYITWAMGISIDVSKVLTALFNVAAVFIPICVIENISYYPVLGAGGVYLSCITGNIMNMKLPAAVSGMTIAGVEPGSKEGEVIAILCVAMSSITTAAILFIGMLGIGYLVPYLQMPFLKPGFDNIMPALMGALSVPFFVKNTKISATPIAVSILLCLTLGPTVVQRRQSYIMPCVMLLAVAAAYVLQKQKDVKK
ncbi:MAG: hypothetical protein LBG12_11925 [Synergistaceae bacterium]|jgi:hypothetical protein|nr:hypothetical protein [Synergistaceae bacterium]